MLVALVILNLEPADSADTFPGALEPHWEIIQRVINRRKVELAPKTNRLSAPAPPLSAASKLLLMFKRRVSLGRRLSMRLYVNGLSEKHFRTASVQLMALNQQRQAQPSGDERRQDYTEG
jgi:hypothetical protein